MAEAQTVRSASAARNLARSIINGKVLVAYSIVALSLKSFILLGFIANIPFCLFPNMRAAFHNFDMYPSVYWCWVAAINAPALFFRRAGRACYVVIVSVVISTIFIFDLWYFRALRGFTSFQHLRALKNLHNLAGSIFAFVHPQDFLFLADIAVLLVYLAFREKREMRRSILTGLALLALSVGALIYLRNAEVDEVRVFDARWRPAETIAVSSPIGYHFFDAVAFFSESGRLELSTKEHREIRTWFDRKKEHMSPSRYWGLFRNYNLILLQCESLENFVIDKKINDQEVTPNLNRLVQHSLYFTNYMEQVADGTSIDCEYMVNTSIYPLRYGTAAFRYPRNSYASLPVLLKNNGYSTVDIHPDPGSYWNWAELMRDIGMMQCLDGSHFDQDEIIDLGLSDASFLRQAVKEVIGLKQPFYGYLITLTNHAPFNLPVRLRELKLGGELDTSEVGGYLQSVHYMDKQIGIFLDRLEAAGLLDHTLVGIFGDHCGIHKFSKYDVERLPEETRKSIENGMRIPLIFYNKHQQGKRIDALGGQIDALPTITALMGFDASVVEATAMGRDLLNTSKNFVVLGDGTFLSTEGSKSEQEHALQGMDIAEEIIRSDYFKMYESEFLPSGRETASPVVASGAKLRSRKPANGKMQ